MEDAMIISKPAFERGFGHGCIYKSEHVDLKFVLQNPQSKVIEGQIRQIYTSHILFHAELNFDFEFAEHFYERSI